MRRGLWASVLIFNAAVRFFRCISRFLSENLLNPTCGSVTLDLFKFVKRGESNEPKSTQAKRLFGQDRLCPLGGRRFGRPRQYLAFPYLAAKYGGGIFLLIYIILAFTFGYTMIVAETALGRMTRKSPVGAFAAVRKGGRSFGGWINAIIPILIVPYYSVIGGWVIRYLADYVSGHGSELATDGYFSAFISAALRQRYALSSLPSSPLPSSLQACATAWSGSPR